MRKLFAIMAAAALGFGGIASDSSANSIAFVPTGPTVITVGQTTTFNLVVTLTDADLISAIFQVDVDPGLGIIQANNTAAGMGGATSNFALRTLGFIQVGSCSGPAANPVCTAAAPGAPSAGNAGGTAAGVLNAGTFTLGSYTVLATAEGTPDITIRIRPGFEWLDSYYNNVANPTSTPLLITVNPIPEPATAALLGLGLVGLVMAGRRNRA